MISKDDYYHERPAYELPFPDLEPQPITSDAHMNCTPEKLELVGGFLVSKAEDNYWRVGVRPTALWASCGKRSRSPYSPSGILRQALPFAPGVAEG